MLSVTNFLTSETMAFLVSLDNENTLLIVESTMGLKEIIPFLFSLFSSPIPCSINIPRVFQKFPYSWNQ